MARTELLLQNHRSLMGYHNIELRPLTLLYGVNNAGKSVVLRGLPLLADSFSAQEGGAPLALRSPALRGASFHDVLSHDIPNDQEHYLGLGLRHQDLEFCSFFSWEDRLLHQQRFVVREAETFVQATRRVLRTPGLAFDLETSEGDFPAISFQANGPIPLPLEEQNKLDAVRTLLHRTRRSLTSFSSHVQWLTSTRRMTQRQFALPGQPTSRLDPEGQDAPALLAMQPDLQLFVSEWYQANFGLGIRTADGPDPSTIRLRVEPQGIDLIDTGEGLAHILPIITTIAMARTSSDPQVIAVEEPEAHLHESIQKELAFEFCDLAIHRADDSIATVLETHSEYFMLAVQLRIAEGKLPPDRVLMYWVRQLSERQTILEKIEFNEDGRPEGNLPPGLFNTDTAVAKQVIEARRKRHGSRR